ncbi:MAG: aminoacyl-tRNA hydrolase [Devosiaceae bacterium]|nr:aminoacyl-tRNA hydrolase [Devosiaceae bacterium MH13]
MHLIVGLGNPGASYARNRHNIGFMAVDDIHERHEFSPWRSRFSAQVSEGRIGSSKVLLVKPETYMNLSGQAVGEALRFFKLNAADVSVIHDELDLEPGRCRIKRGGGHGGHNGLKSLDAHIGKDYRRIRAGIGHPGHKDLVSGYVLKDFPKAEEPWVDAFCDALARDVELLLDDKDSDLNSRLNEATRAAQPQAKPAPDAKPAKKPGKAQSHIRQARGPTAKQVQANVPTKGPMADMLRKLLGKDQ